MFISMLPLMSNALNTNKYIASVTMIIPKKFSTTPTFAILGILMYSLPKTIALGGVATGIIKANDVDIVAGIIMIKGLIFSESASAASIGSIIVMVAVLEVISVRKVRNKQVKIISVRIEIVGR